MIRNLLNKIIKGDCIEVLKTIPDGKINLIFADPPYNLQINDDLYRPNQTKVNGVNDNWDKFESFKEYDEFTISWLKESRRVMDDNATIWVIGSYHNIFRIGKIMQDLGFWILNDIIWIKSNPMPNFRGRRFTNAHETLIWAAKSKKSKYTFNYKSMKVYNGDKQMRSDWYIPICTGKERIYKNGKKVHSTQKPEALLYRIILSSSKVNDIVLDPFFGTGTTGAVAKRLKRNYIGIEKREDYIEIAKERIEKIQPIEDKYLSLKIEEKMPRVPFGNLVEKGFISPGEHLYSADRRYSATVLSNGALLYNGAEASIHKISAKILGKSANNGWMFWYVERKGRLISINELRKEYIKIFLEKEAVHEV